MYRSLTLFTNTHAARSQLGELANSVIGDPEVVAQLREDRITVVAAKCLHGILGLIRVEFAGGQEVFIAEANARFRCGFAGRGGVSRGGEDSRTRGCECRFEYATPIDLEFFTHVPFLLVELAQPSCTKSQSSKVHLAGCLLPAFSSRAEATDRSRWRQEPAVALRPSWIDIVHARRLPSG